MSAIRILRALALGAATLFAANALSPESRAQNVVRIGAPLALTGALADSGKKQKLGFDLWLERVKKAGGIKAGYRACNIDYRNCLYSLCFFWSIYAIDTCLSGGNTAKISQPDCSIHTGYLWHTPLRLCQYGLSFRTIGFDAG